MTHEYEMETEFKYLTEQDWIDFACEYPRAHCFLISRHVKRELEKIEDLLSPSKIVKLHYVDVAKLEKRRQELILCNQE